MTLRKRFGIMVFMDKPTAVEFNDDEIVNVSDYDYTAEIFPQSSWNGNGTNSLQIKTAGKYELIHSGMWEISPIIRMSYSWNYNIYSVDVKDPEGNKDSFAIKTYRGSCSVGIVINRIFELENFCSIEEYKMKYK